ncbi:hypothetical protein AN216_10290 [Streptomyces oceani]|uniref:Uncharacterized protein n=1 Tax=Streptomyces oceani TaxID=1075402 RepID=A0A1E7KII7_9ACTN|nr:hypothetical protein AN216_10290 [Streptomyces oceani]
MVLAAVLAGLGVAASGCGIQSTSVPVDAGAAPSRAACVLPEDESNGVGPGRAPVRIYLLCGSRLVPAERLVRLPETRHNFARVLLDQLQQRPDQQERAAGFESKVPSDLLVEEPAADDPTGTIRLSEPLDTLPAYALAQLVCSYAESGAADNDNTVLLGGPREDEDAELRRYTCGTQLRNEPKDAASAGTTA